MSLTAGTLRKTRTPFAFRCLCSSGPWSHSLQALLVALFLVSRFSMAELQHIGLWVDYSCLPQREADGRDRQAVEQGEPSPLLLE